MEHFENVSSNFPHEQFDRLDSSRDSVLAPSAQVRVLQEKIVQANEKINNLKKNLNIIAEEDFRSTQGQIIDKGFELHEAEAELEALNAKMENINSMKQEYSNVEKNINSIASQN
jgi:prefoldin subunit 5